MNNSTIVKVHGILEKEFEKYRMPIVELISIQTDDPFRVLVTTILSARTKDEMTAEVVRKLFKKVKRVSDFSKYSEKEIAEMIYPVGFYKNKARFLKDLPSVLEEEFDGVIPDTVDDLVKLPGVGRKTANLVVGCAFKKPAVCVDTHVHKILNRLGYVNTKTPLETEMAVRKKLPKKYWITLNTYLVAFGQNMCRPISPHCSKCPIEKYCPKKGVKSKR